MRFKITSVRNKKIKLYLALFLSLLFISYPIYLYHSLLWRVIDKIGALATALALIAVMYQSFVARKAAMSSIEFNANNLFQQKFNLILEQHNHTLTSVNEWFKATNLNPYNFETVELIKKLRGHENLSPYMRILYHTLKAFVRNYPQHSI